MKGKRMGVMFFICVLALGVISNIYAKSNNEEIQISTNAGLNGSLLFGYENPIWVEVSNSGKDLVGAEVQVVSKRGVSDSETQNIVHAKPLELLSGGTKEFVFSVLLNVAKSDYTVRVVRGNKVIAEQAFQYKSIVNPNTLVIGTLSNDNNALLELNNIKTEANKFIDGRLVDAFNSAQIQNSQTNEEEFFHSLRREIKVINFDERNFPENKKWFKGFDMFIVSGFDVKKLKDGQLKTLNNWVNKGGNLVVTMGENWEKSRSIFEALDIDVAHTEVMKVNVSGGLLTGEFMRNYEVLEKLPIAYTFINGGKAIMGIDIIDLTIVKPVGKGHVYTITFDPTVSPFRNWSKRDEFWDNFMKKLTFMPQRSEVRRITDSYGENIINIEGIALMKGIGIVMGIYIILIGPVLYYVLKKKNKREWAWTIAVAVAILCLGGISVYSISSGYKTPLQISTSEIHLNSESKNATIYSRLNLFNNKKRNMDIQFASQEELENYIEINTDMDGYGDIVPTNSNGYYRMNAGNLVGYAGNEPNEEDSVEVKYLDAEKPVHRYSGIELWEEVSMNYEKKIELENTIESRLYIEGNRVKGLIKNNTQMDMNHAFIDFYGKYLYIGDLFAGKEMTVDVDWTGKQVNSDLEDFLLKNYGTKLSYGKELKYYNEPFAERALTNYVDEFNPYWRTTTPDDIAFQYYIDSASSVIDSFEQEAEKNRGVDQAWVDIDMDDLLKVKLVGFNREKVVESVEVNGQKPRNEVYNTVICDLKVRTKRGVEFRVPEEKVPVMYDGELRYEPYSSDLDQLETILYVPKQGKGILKFQVPSNLDISKLTLKFTGSDRNSDQYVKEILNVKTQQWEVCNAVQSLPLDTIEDYMNNEGVVTVRVRATDFVAGEDDENDFQDGIQFKEEMPDEVPEVPNNYYEEIEDEEHDRAAMFLSVELKGIGK